jgi:hypothetical protein
MFGSAATARVLLEHGANVDRCEKVRDLQHEHALLMIICYGLTPYRLDGQLLWLQVIIITRR